MSSSKSKGSAALGVMASVMFGVLVVLTFNNAGQYLLAQSAVEQAARAAARCLTPTDPECVEILGMNPGVSGTSKEWYGFLPLAKADRSTTLDLYKYTSSIDKRESTATYDSYEWQMQNVAARWDEVRVPTASFAGALNRYARLFGTVSLPTTMTQKELRPLFEPPYVNFPAAAVTDDRNNYASITQVIQLQNEYGNNIPWGLVDSDPRLANVRTTSEPDGAYYVIPPSNDKLIVYSPEIRVPTIPHHPCKTYQGIPCQDDINRAAILDSRQYINEQGLWDYAHVALIPAAIIKNKGNKKTTLRWSENFYNMNGQLKNGLWVEVFDQTGRQTKTYCLGARTTHGFRANVTIPFNMDIVGPRGANDGIPGDCEVPKGVGDFSSIKVRRGGSFRIKAMLRRHDDNVGANELLAQVRFLYWFDQYKVIDAPVGAGPKLTCPVMFSTEVSRPYCEGITLNKCTGYKSNLIADMSACTTNWQANWKATRWEPHCSNVRHAFYITDQMRASHSVSGPQGVAICDDKWLPTYNGKLNAFSSVCTWNKTKGKSLLVGDVVGECPLASRTARTIACGKHLLASVTDKNILEACPEVLTKIASKEAANNYKLLQKNAAGVDTDFSLSATVPVLAVPSGETSWDFKYTNIYYDGKEISEPSQIRPYLGANPKTVTIANYKKESGYPEISKVDFTAKIVSQSAGSGSETYGWEDMLGKMSIAQEESTLVIDDVWPFSEPRAARPYHKGLEETYVYDYNDDCVVDAKCLGINANYTSLDQALRTLATKSKKLEVDLTNPDYVFNWNEEFKEKAVVDLQNEEYPECSQYQTLGCAHDNDFKIALGVSADEPEVCKNGTYTSCYSVERYQTDSFATYDLGSNNEPAKNAALYEMKRLIPFVENCENASRAGCVAVEIDSTSELEVKVRTKINMPISFPLNAVWGDSIVVESELNSVREIGRLG